MYQVYAKFSHHRRIHLHVTRQAGYIRPEMSADRILVHYSSNLPLILAVDACLSGLSATCPTQLVMRYTQLHLSPVYLPYHYPDF